MGLYPKGSPKWDNNFCKAGEEETQERKKAAEGVVVPEWDPVVSLWTSLGPYDDAIANKLSIV